MFEAMMGLIEDDFVQYVFHLQVVVDGAHHLLGNVQYSAPSDPVQGSTSIASAMAAEAQQMGARPQFIGRPEGRPRRSRPRSRWSPRNLSRVEKTPGATSSVLLREWQEVQAVPRSLNARLLGRPG